MTRYSSRVLLGLGLFPGFCAIAPMAIAAEASANTAKAAGSSPTSLAPENDSVPAPLALPVRNRRGLTLDGAAGLLRTMSADANPKKTVSLQLSESLYWGKGFLCPDCTSADGSVSSVDDDSFLSSSRLQLSIAATQFVEGFASVQFQSTSNDQSEPQVLQMSGNTVVGVKGFTPWRRGRAWSAGALADLRFMARPHSVSGITVSGELGGIASLDLRELRTSVPLRMHFNAVYWFDNSWRAAAATEKQRSDGPNIDQRVARIERLGFAIRRTDILRPGLAVEGAFERYRPFAEWSIDLPVNRQDHLCDASILSAGDSCLDRTREFAAIPSRLSIGLRAYPFNRPVLDGIGLLAALDIGTGGTSNFVEEAMPEVPFMLHLGLSYSLDAEPRVVEVVKIKEVAVAPKVEATKRMAILGRVVEVREDDSTEVPVPAAHVLFRADDPSGMITGADGRFQTPELSLGHYRFRITKEAFGDAECDANVSIPEPSATGSAAATTGDEKPAKEITCRVVRLTTNAAISGIVRDGKTTLFLANAKVSVFDQRGRQLSLSTDEYGAFRVGKIPAGSSRIYVEADGYLPNAAQLELKPRDTAEIQLALHPRPTQSSITSATGKLALKHPLRFVHDSAELLPESLVVVEELAEAIKRQAKPQIVEIKGYAQESSSTEHDLALSRSRAESVQKSLVLLGVSAERLVTNAYGAEHPVAPSSTALNRSKNDRVEIGLVGQK